MQHGCSVWRVIFLVLNFMASVKAGSHWKHSYLNLLFISVLILEYLLIGVSDLEHHSD